MLEDVKVAYQRLLESNQMKSYKEKNPDAYLVSFSFMADYSKIDSACWQVDYYSASSGKIASFLIKEQIELLVEQEPLSAVLQLNIESVKIGFGDAIAIAEKAFANIVHEKAQSVVDRNIRNTILEGRQYTIRRRKRGCYKRALG